MACFATPALAQTGINITPTNLAMTMAVGDETREVVTLRNISAGAVEVEAAVEPSGAEDGAIAIAVTPEKVELKAGESATVEVNVRVPDDAVAGAQQGFVMFNVVDSHARDVAIVGKVRTSVTVNVIRPISDVEFSYPMFVGSSGPVTFNIKGRNTSEFATDVEAVVELGRLLGDDLVLSQSILLANQEAFNMQALWEEPPLFGVKRLTISVSSGVGAPVKKSSLILIFNWKLLPPLMGVLVAAFILRGKLPAIIHVFRHKWRQ
ncbi:MAG: COG1470 family protein [Thermoleophilia bacterium]